MDEIVLICKGDVFPIGDNVFNDSTLLSECINRYMDEKQLNPIYIDKNVAIFKKYYLAAFFEKDLIKPADRDNV